MRNLILAILMRFKIVLLPALLMFVVSSYLICLASLGLQTMRNALVSIAFNLFIGGTALTIFWFLLTFPSFYFALRQRKKTHNFDFDRSTHMSIRWHVLNPTFTNLVTASLLLLGSAVLVWMAQITWHDVTVWNKSLSMIFFGSRTGENISLGIDLKLIHYFLISLGLLISASLIFIYGKLQRTLKTLKEQINQLERRNYELRKLLSEVRKGDQVQG